MQVFTATKYNKSKVHMGFISELSIEEWYSHNLAQYLNNN
jgi:hypothetical protein